MFDDDEKPPLVLDCGAHTTKAGFAGDDTPRSLFPTEVGYPKVQQAMLGCRFKDCYVGGSCASRRGILKIRRPIEHGIVTNWDDMEKVWEYTFQEELRVNSTEHAVLLTDGPSSPMINREKSAQILFECFGIMGMNIQLQGVLSVYASGRCNAMVLDIGDSQSHVLPVFEGYVLKEAIVKSNVTTGQRLTDYMHSLLLESHTRAALGGTTSGGPGAAGGQLQGERGGSGGGGADGSASAMVDSLGGGGSASTLVRDIKEKLGFVAEDFEEEVGKQSSSRAGAGCENGGGMYELPDGTIIGVGDARFRCPEALFSPGKLLGLDAPGIHELVYASLQKCDMTLRKDFYTNIVLSGAGTMFKGLDRRLQGEIGGLIPPKMNCRVVAPPERKFSAWIGGSIVGSLSNFKGAWITKAEYDEHGPGIVHTRLPQY